MITVKTFDTILTEICDAFDTLIRPRKITRSNTNIIYLILKACAKGYEIINNVCVVVYNKFDPANCDMDDLNSVADIVGTERYQASASGLRIIASNTSTEEDAVLPVGTYTYKQSEESIFEFEVTSPVTIEKEGYHLFVAMSTTTGSHYVTEQDSISVESTADIPSDISFSCADNSNLQGVPAETDAEFRSRVLLKPDREHTMVELETSIKNLPYVFDCQLRYNTTLNPVVYDEYTIPPHTALLLVSGEIKNEIAEIFAKKVICPSLETATSTPVFYYNNIFADGAFKVNVVPFTKVPFDIEVEYKIDPVYAKQEDVENSIRTKLRNRFISEVHEDYIKEDYIWQALSSLDYAGVEILSVNIIYGGTRVDYLEVGITKIAELNDVSFSVEGV